jgi:uncharacterized NAD(P)/FAD-binding protein YdhS
VLSLLKTPSQKIAIIGAGFTGVALAAALHRYATQPLEIYLIEKTGQFGAGDAYRTPFSYHLLNARAGDMSAFHDDPDHFVRWLLGHAATYLDTEIPPAQQFVPRVLYHQYLCSLMAAIFREESVSVKLHLISDEAIDLVPMQDGVHVALRDQPTLLVDQVVMAHGNNPPACLPGAISSGLHYIANPWDYVALKSIPSAESVLIVGTGLSMVDAVLTLHHQEHRGKIYAVSRRGLLPLPHSEQVQACTFDMTTLPINLRAMVKAIRLESRKLMAQGGDWRAIINKLRAHLPGIWAKMDVSCKKRFIRHVLPYWNIHRHRVNEKISDVLAELRLYGQLEVIAGRVESLCDQQAVVAVRHVKKKRKLNILHIINCMGSSSEVVPGEQLLLNALLERGSIQYDPLRLGFAATSQFQLKTAKGKILPSCYTLGPPMRGELWECVAVPEIRQQCRALAQILLAEKKQIELSPQESKMLTLV